MKKAIAAVNIKDKFYDWSNVKKSSVRIYAGLNLSTSIFKKAMIRLVVISQLQNYRLLIG